MNDAKQPTRDEVEWTGEKWVHKPTGADLHLKSDYFFGGRCDQELANGVLYEPRDVHVLLENMKQEYLDSKQ